MDSAKGALTVNSSLPLNASLVDLKKQAKSLLHDSREDMLEAVTRVRQHLPTEIRVGLRRVQKVIAREYGFPDWNAMASYIEPMEALPVAPLKGMSCPRRERCGRRDLNPHRLGAATGGIAIWL